MPEPDQLDVPRDARPRHIAVIMDGNGRWAQRRGEPRVAGHRAGALAVRTIVTECARLGLDALTLYSFSSENWKRPADEVNALMSLLVEYLASERQELLDNNIRFLQIGQRTGLSDHVLAAIDDTVQATAHCSGLTLALALNYGSRAEITDAVRAIVAGVRSGAIDPESIDEDTVSNHLYTAGLPDPDLLIRTAGEYRLSNYLLWQLSYAEFHITDSCWPDFDEQHLHDAIRAFASRERRFGSVTGQTEDSGAQTP